MVPDFQVFKGELIDGSGRRVAIKCVDKNRSESKRLKLEIQSLKNAHHKNIVELLYVRYTSDTLYVEDVSPPLSIH